MPLHQHLPLLVFLLLVLHHLPLLDRYPVFQLLHQELQTRYGCQNSGEEETQDALDEGVLNETVRADITRTLVTLLTAKYGPKPSRTQYEDLARQFILKYPFAKDDLGSGYVSGVVLDTI